jgi:putative ABC transport system permease protein
VNAAFAHKRWAPGGALGKRVRVAYQGQGAWKTIVGVAEDASTMGPGSISTAPFLYRPLSAPGLQTTILLRADNVDDLAGTVRRISKSLDPLLAAPKVEGVEHVVDAAVAGPRFTMLLLTAFTVLALVLAAVGLYGVMAYSVAQRTREIGIRMALGATQSVIARSVVTRGVALAAVGAVLGLGGAYWGTRLIEKMLYGVNKLDAASFAAGAAVLLLTAILACVVPTRRALGVDPIRAIRAD